MPVISGLTLTVTDSTIVATWTTDVAADSNLFVTGGGVTSKPGIDNGFAAASTSHQAIVAGLLPGMTYSCVVTSGGTSSTPQNATTNARPSRKVAISATNGSVSTVAASPRGDTYHNFVSSDNFTYMTQDDGNGFVAGSPNSGYNTQVGKITDETQLTGTLVSLSNYGSKSSTSGTDGPSGASMTNKNTGIFGLNGNLHVFVYRQFPPTYTSNRYCNVIKSTNHGSTWNSFNQPSTFTANGNVLTPQSPAEPVQFHTNTVGLVTPVLYAADDGTLGYNTAGNQIDGGNAYVYCTYRDDSRGNQLGLLRIPRIKFDAQQFSFEYWVGSVNPTVDDFTNDHYWSSSPTNATAILGNKSSWVQVVFVPTINSYILSTYEDITVAGGSTTWHFYSAPTPAGPWVEFFRQENTTTNNHWYGPFPLHRDVITNNLSDSIPIRFIYQGEPAGTQYKPNWSTLTITTAAYTYAGCLAYQTGSQPQSTTGTTSTSLTFNNPNIAGSCLVLTGYTGGGIVTVDDNAGSCGAPGNNTGWTRLHSDAGEIWVCYNCYGTTSPITVTIHSTTSGFAIISGLYEITGGVNAVDQDIVQAKTSVTSFTTYPINVTRAQSMALLVTSLSVQREATTPPPWHDVVGLKAPALPFAGSAYRALTATGNLTATETLNTSGNATYRLFNLYGQQYSISGNAGTPGATVTFLGPTSNDSGSVVADGSGNYTIPNLYGGSYIIVPSSGSSLFSPTSRTVTLFGANVTGVNFTQNVAMPSADGRCL